MALHPLELEREILTLRTAAILLMRPMREAGNRSIAHARVFEAEPANGIAMGRFIATTGVLRHPADTRHLTLSWRGHKVTVFARTATLGLYAFCCGPVVFKHHGAFCLIQWKRICLRLPLFQAGYS